MRDVDAFLARSGWGDATRAPLAGDASNRRYERLRRADGTRAVLMDAPPDRGEDVRPFVRTAQYLRSLGLSAPDILAQDEDAGFLLLEDLGDQLIAREVANDPAQELPLYRATVDLLADLHRHPAPADLTVLTPKTLSEMTGLAFEYYANPVLDASKVKAICAELEPVFTRCATDYPVFIHRDFHAENLFWLPNRNAPANIGLLDFQDAVAGHPAYDLVSLLQDVRRDVSPATQDAMIDHYLARTGMAREPFLTAYHALGAQRNLRILGVFCRLASVSGKSGYLSLLPRVWRNMTSNLGHPALAPLARIVDQHLSPPDDALIERIRKR